MRSRRKWLEERAGDLPERIRLHKVFLAGPDDPLVQKMRIQSIPTLISFKDEVEEARIAGAFSQHKVKEFVDSVASLSQD